MKQQLQQQQQTFAFGSAYGAPQQAQQQQFPHAALPSFQPLGFDSFGQQVLRAVCVCVYVCVLCVVCVCVCVCCACMVHVFVCVCVCVYIGFMHLSSASAAALDRARVRACM
jgi:hypothetical protein